MTVNATAGPPSRLGRGRVITGALLIAAAMAVVFSLTAGPAPAPSTPPASAAALAAPTPAPSAAAMAAASPATPAGAQGSPPLHITYSGVSMNQNVLPLTPAQGQTTLVPPATQDAYWLTPYGSPGSPDTTYIVGHSWEGRDTAFNYLSTRATPGDQITLTTDAGPTDYTVKTITTETKNTLKDSPIWDKIPNRLILISCYTADLRGTNIIITADQTPAP